MMNASQFIEQCREVITEYENGKQSLNDAAAKIMPAKIGKYKLVSTEVGEYLTEPYYSTSIA